MGPLLHTNPPPDPKASSVDMAEAYARERSCRDYKQLRAEGMSLRKAARALGKGVAFFSGEDCMFQRYQRHGWEGLLPRRKGRAAR